MEQITVERTDMGVHVIRYGNYVITGYFGQMTAYVEVTNHATALGEYDNTPDDFHAKFTAWLISLVQVPYQPSEKVSDYQVKAGRGWRTVAVNLPASDVDHIRGRRNGTEGKDYRFI